MLVFRIGDNKMNINDIMIRDMMAAEKRENNNRKFIPGDKMVRLAVIAYHVWSVAVILALASCFIAG